MACLFKCIVQIYVNVLELQSRVDKDQELLKESALSLYLILPSIFTIYVIHIINPIPDTD